MKAPSATVSEIAHAVVRCPKCGAIPKESCADRMYVDAKDRGDEKAAAELDLIARAAPLLMHPERLKEARRLVDAAVAYGLVEFVR